MKNIIKILFTIMVCCSLSNLTMAQGTIGEYPGAGVGFDSGCGYLDAGNSDPGVMDVGLTGNVCGSAFDVTFGPWTETAAGFDITGFELNNFDIDQEAVYGIRLFYGPQDNCCTICLDAMLDLGQEVPPMSGNPAPCGTFGPQTNLSAFGYPVPAMYGQNIFGEPVIPYEDMCPNTEYFAQYQFIGATEVDLTDPDGNMCAMDDALITSVGTLTTVQTLVAPGTRDPFVINATTLTPVAAADCASTDVLFDFTADVTSGCVVDFGVCSKGLEIELRASLTCADGSTIDLNTGPLVNDPTNCFVGIANTNEVTTQISLGDAAAVCAIFECDPNAMLEVYARHTFCEADDIAGDGSGVDEAITTVSLASILAEFDAAMCCTVVPPTCMSTYNFTAPTVICNGDVIDFVVDAGCDVSLNTVDFGGGTGVDPSLDLDIYIYVDPATGSTGQAPAGFTVIPADMDGATGNPDIGFLGTAGTPSATAGSGCGDFQIPAGTFYNGTCAPKTVSFFVVPYSYDYDIDGDGTYGAYLADGNANACPVLQYDILINPVFEVFESTADGCDPSAMVFAGDGMGGIFDTNGDGNFDDLDACMTAQLDPTANCDDGATLDYDFSALDVGACSGALTGTLTCACPLDCPAFNAISLAAGCAVIDLCIGYIDSDADGTGDNGENPSGTTMTVDIGAAAGLGTAINDGLFLFDSSNDGVDQSDAVGYCFTYVYEHQGCDPVPYSGLINLLCADGTPGMLDLGGGPIALAPDVDILGSVFGSAGGGAFYPVLTAATTAAVCPTLADGSDAVAASVQISSPDGTACGDAIMGEAPACDATGGNAAEPVQLNAIADPLLTTIFMDDPAFPYLCTINETADLSYTCAACDEDPCTADAGTITADAAAPCVAGGETSYIISATPDGNNVIPTDYEVTYVLTSGAGLIIEAAGATPSFDLVALGLPLSGIYTIHCLVAETSDSTSPDYLDLSTIVFGTTTGGDVLGILAGICGSLDAVGAPFDLQPCGCDLIISIDEVSCDDGGTPEDTSDDMITYSVTVTGGPGTTWSGTDDNGGTYTNVAYGTATSTMTLSNPGSVSVTVTDDTDSTCTLDSTVTFDGCTMPAIPTLSQWGLMSLALLLMIFGALQLGRATVTSYRIRK